MEDINLNIYDTLKQLRVDPSFLDQLKVRPCYDRILRYGSDREVEWVCTRGAMSVPQALQYIKDNTIEMAVYNYRNAKLVPPATWMETLTGRVNGLSTRNVFLE